MRTMPVPMPMPVHVHTRNVPPPSPAAWRSGARDGASSLRRVRTRAPPSSAVPNWMIKVVDKNGTRKVELPK